MPVFDVFRRFQTAYTDEPLQASDTVSIAAGTCVGISRLIAFIAVSALSFAFAPAGWAADHGQLGPTSPEVKAWAGTLENKLKEGCCSTAHGWKPEEVEYEFLRYDKMTSIVVNGVMKEKCSSLTWSSVWFRRSGAVTSW
jgi:hypothetical protein